MFGFPKWTAAEGVAGLIGAAIWAGISYAVNTEVGWIAWGIGFFVGFAVRMVAGEREEGFAPGLTAAIISILAVLGGKYAAVHLLVSHHMANVATAVSEEEMLVGLADEIVGEREKAGQKVVFPAGKTVETAESQADYPPEIWAAAAAKCSAIPPNEQAEKMQAVREFRTAMVAGAAGRARGEVFAASFSI
ncbi:MAG: hypothetical protein SFU86_21660 [Pirellulaceae bacterium]|nr:hypothetical protein [Pirellulaceae bacterium]